MPLFLVAWDHVGRARPRPFLYVGNGICNLGEVWCQPFLSFVTSEKIISREVYASVSV